MKRSNACCISKFGDENYLFYKFWADMYWNQSEFTSSFSGKNVSPVREWETFNSMHRMLSSTTIFSLTPLSLSLSLTHAYNVKKMNEQTYKHTQLTGTDRYNVSTCTSLWSNAVHPKSEKTSHKKKTGLFSTHCWVKKGLSQPLDYKWTYAG